MQETAALALDALEPMLNAPAKSTYVRVKSAAEENAVTPISRLRDSCTWIQISHGFREVVLQWRAGITIVGCPQEDSACYRLPRNAIAIPFGGAPNDDSVRMLARCCPLLTTVSIEAEDLQEASLVALAKGCRNLQALRLRRGCADTGEMCLELDDAIHAMAEHLPNLRNLELDFLPGMEAMTAVAKACPLQIVRIAFERADYDYDMAGLCGDSLELPQSATWHGGKHALHSLVQHCDSLQELAYMLPLTGRSESSPVRPDEGITHRETLNAFDYHHDDKRFDLQVATDDLLDQLIARASSLRVLSLDGCETISGSSLPALLQQNPLTCLELRSCPSLSAGNAAAALSAAPHLRSLLLTEGCELDDTVLQAIGRTCVHLTRLELSHDGFDNYACTDQGLMALGQLKALEDLGIARFMSARAEGLAAVAAGCESLRRLDLSGCHGAVTEEGMLALSAARHLDRLTINECRFATPAVMRAIYRACPSLICLSIAECSGILPVHEDAGKDIDSPTYAPVEQETWLEQVIPWRAAHRVPPCEETQLPKLIYLHPYTDFRKRAHEDPDWIGYGHMRPHPDEMYPLPEEGLTWRL